MRAQGDKQKTTTSAVAALLAGLCLWATAARAQVSKDLESLGGNQAIEKRAAKLSSSHRSEVVQGRAVDLNNRLEVVGFYGPVAAGNSYLFTQNWGVLADWHFVPQFALGARYEQAFNSLTNEGKSALEGARGQQAQGNAYQYPDIDYPNYSIMGTATWNMFYGKLNFFDVKVVQFDFYSIGGFGQMNTARNVSPTWTAGGGFAFWLAQHFSSRIELRYQTYKDKPYTGERDLNVIVANFGFGVLL